MWQGLQTITDYKTVPHACNWILDFLTERPQALCIRNITSAATTLSTGSPQDCVFSTLLFTLKTHDCSGKYDSNHIIKFADDTTLVGLIINYDDTAYSGEVEWLACWCQENNLSLNVDKMKEMTIDFRKAHAAPSSHKKHQVSISTKQ